MAGDLKKVVYLSRVARGRFTPAEPQGTPCIFDPDDDFPPPDPVGLGRDAFMLYAAKKDGEIIRNLGMTFYGVPDVPNFESLEGVKILMGQPIFQFLRAVHADDLQRAIELMLTSGSTIRPRLNQPSFFFSRGSSDACFVTPAHVVRSTDMAVYLARHLGVRFDLPDSEGRLPQLYWASHAKDDVLFSYAEQQLGVDTGTGGFMEGVRGEAYVRPIWRAIEANNAIAAKGLSLCSKACINTPRPGDYGRFTPLMIQSVKADHALARTGGLPIGATLKTAWALARSPNIAWDACDHEGHTLADFPMDTRLRRFLERARAHPWPTEPLGLAAKLA